MRFILVFILVFIDDKGKQLREAMPDLALALARAAFLRQCRVRAFVLCTE